MFVVMAAAALLAAAAAPFDTEARLRAGGTALAAREYATAKGEFTAVLVVDPGNSTAHLSLGIIALVEGDAVAGLRHFSAVPGDPRALIGRLDCELRLTRFTEARVTAARLDPMTAGNAAASGHVGTLLAKAGEYGAAARFLRQGAGAAAASLLGTVEEKLGDLPAAAKAFAEAARLEPGHEDYRVDHAAMLLTSGDVEGSVAAFRTAARDFPKSARVRIGLGSALFIEGQHDAAAAALLEAVRLEPGARAFDLLGKAYESAGELRGQVQTEFEKYLATGPRDAQAYAHYSSILQNSGDDPELARKAVARALELDPNLFSAHLQMGILEQSTGNLRAALARFEHAEQLEPDNAMVHYRLSVLHRRLGNPEKARAELEAFQRLKR